MCDDQTAEKLLKQCRTLVNVLMPDHCLKSILTLADIVFIFRIEIGRIRKSYDRIHKTGLERRMNMHGGKEKIMYLPIRPMSDICDLRL